MDIAAEKRLDLIAIGYLLLATFVAHFLLVKHFGLYEDDYLLVAAPMVSEWHNILDYITSNFTHWYQGRPLGLSVITIFAFFGSKAGGLLVIYFLGYAVIATNVCLTYIILRKFVERFAALSGALIFCLYPADTTKILLTHSLILQFAWTCSLAAALAYLNNRTKLFFALSCLPLITYESVFLPLLALPMTRMEFSRNYLKHYAKYGGGLLLIVCAYALIRIVFFSERRLVNVSHLNPLDLVEAVFSAVIMGPILSASTFFIRPATALMQGNFYSWVFIISFFTLTLAALYFLGHNRADTQADTSARLPIGASGVKDWFRSALQGNLADPVRLIATGLVMWPISYLLAFTHWPPSGLNGRANSSVHMAGHLSACLLVAGLLSLLLASKWVASGNRPTRLSLIAVLASYLSLLAGFSFIVQQDFAESWARQKSFWRQVISLTPDMHEHSLIFVPQNSLNNTHPTYIQTRSWGNSITLYYIYPFPDAFKEATPRVIFVDKELLSSVKKENGVWVWSTPRFTGGSIQTVSEKIDLTNAIFLGLRKSDGKLRRLTGPVKLMKGLKIFVPDIGPANNYPKTPVYDLIMDRD